MKSIEIFFVFLKLGLISFGGPIAHIGYFNHEFVNKRKWLSQEAYLNLVALCNFLPGPASSQVGFAIGLSRGGFLGAFLAWLGFTLPSSIVLMLFALSLSEHQQWVSSGVIHGLKIVAVAVVAQALFSMSKKMLINRLSITILVVACALVLLFPSAWIQLIAIVIAAILGCLLFKQHNAWPTNDVLSIKLSKRVGIISLCLFIIILIITFIASVDGIGKLFAIFYQTGALVFGGGHVVLPLLDARLVQPELITQSGFLSGYGAAQAIPGPLFSFAAYLGGSIDSDHFILSSFVSLVAIFLSGFLLLIAILPFWQKINRYAFAKSALHGVNAAVIGLLLAAFYQPVWTSSIFDTKDFLIALIAFCLLEFFKYPPWMIVVLCGILGGLFF